MIKEINNKEDYISLLTEVDPNINIVEDYVDNGKLYGYFLNNEPVSFICINENADNSLEINNLYTLESHRGHGYATKLLEQIENDFPGKDYFVGVASCSMYKIAFFTKRGYEYDHKVENYFLDYYPNEIYENGMQAVDLMYLQKRKTN